MREAQAAAQRKASKATPEEIRALEAIQPEKMAPAAPQTHPAKQPEPPAPQPPQASTQPHPKAQLSEQFATISDRRAVADPHLEDLQPADFDAGLHRVQTIESDAIPGEPEPAEYIFQLGPESERQQAILRAAASNLRQRVEWLRAKVREQRQHIEGIEPSAKAAEELRRLVFADLKELRGMALRNAKRGKPALLRIIVAAAGQPPRPVRK